MLKAGARGWPSSPVPGSSAEGPSVPAGACAGAEAQALGGLGGVQAQGPQRGKRRVEAAVQGLWGGQVGGGGQAQAAQRAPALPGAVVQFARAQPQAQVAGVIADLYPQPGQRPDRQPVLVAQRARPHGGGLKAASDLQWPGGGRRGERRGLCRPASPPGKDQGESDKGS